MSSNSEYLLWQVGSDTDIGGGRENQDDFLVFQKKSLGVIVLCVFDGHGREVGKIAANAARASLLQQCEETLPELMADPTNWLIKAHEKAHYFIKESFKRELERQGYVIEEDRSGYLLKRKSMIQSQTCVHGGSSCSIVAIIGMNMYIANVGDSSGLLCAPKPILNQSLIEHVVDAAISPSSSLKNMRGSTQPSISQELTDNIVITAEHSPESPYEFYRLREFRTRDGDNTQPSLLVVYDSPSHEKSRCNPVFNLEDGKAVVTNNGKYYKNVRKEWASLVSTPLYARFQDALAFTRSLGDLHLSTFGVTHLPEVQHIDLFSVFKQFDISENTMVSTAASSSSSINNHENLNNSTNQPQTVLSTVAQLPLLCLVLASDGVWDNWTYDDVTKFVLDPSCIGAVTTDPEGAKRVALSFMSRNATYAKRNFGTQADNATGIVLYLSNNSNFPVDSKDV